MFIHGPVGFGRGGPNWAPAGPMRAVQRIAASATWRKRGNVMMCIRSENSNRSHCPRLGAGIRRVLTGVDVRAEFRETWTSLRNFVEVCVGRDLFIHLVVGRETGLGEHCQE